MEIQQAILNKVTKIEMYLYDDDDTNNPGLIAQQRAHEKRLDKLENESMVRKSIWATLGLLGGIVGTAVVELILWLIKRN